MATGELMPREVFLARTLVELADSLVDEFDVVDPLTLLADRCVEALTLAAAGIMPSDLTEPFDNCRLVDPAKGTIGGTVAVSTLGSPKLE